MDMYSLFYVAYQNDHESIVQLLIKNGMNVNSLEQQKKKTNIKFFFYIFCRNGRDSIVEN